jgi:dTDP-glucose pyrophosphorylase
MIKKYKEVDLDDAAAGMILAAEVIDHQGSVLLPAGAPLSEKLLTSMRRRGIDHVRIVDDSVSGADLAAEGDRVAQRIAYLFRRPNQGAAHALLRAELEAYRMQGLQ